MASIKKTEWNGLEAVEICAGSYEALMIPSVGANMIRLYNKDKKANILRTPETDEDIAKFKEKPQTFGIPLLFPPNRIEDGTFTYNGIMYKFPINNVKENNHNHGNIKTQRFTVTRTETGADYAEVEASFFSNEINGTLYADFPHQFVCRMIYRLSDKGLKHTVSFTNLGKTPMPLGVGYHTPIMIPFTENGNRDNYKLQLSVGKRWELNERTLPTGNLLPLSAEEQLLREGGMNPMGKAIEIGLQAEPIQVDGRSYNGAVVTDTETGMRVFYEVDDQVKYWTFWNNGGDKNWACPEPQTWATNAPNLKMDAKITGFQTVAPEQTWKMTSKVYVK